MAQQTIILKRSALSGKVPDSASLNLGEVAINTYDGKLYFKKSGSAVTIESILTTNSIQTGSITLYGTGSFSNLIATGDISTSIGTGSFGEVVVANDINISGSSYIMGDIVGLGDIDVSGSISGSTLKVNGLSALNSISASNIQLSGSIRVENTGSFSSLQVNDTLRVNHRLSTISGSLGISEDLTVFGAINASQFNINIISSSTIYQSGSTKFGDTIDDTHQFTGSVDISGSVTATSFVGDGSGLSNIVVDLSLAQLNDVDGNLIPPRSFAELYLACAALDIVDLDFNN